MGIIDKMLKIAGRDSNGFARPIKTNEDGNLEVILKGSDGGTSISGVLTVKDIDSEENSVITGMKDDNGNCVLRVVDSAPFLVEVSQFDVSSQKTVGLGKLSLNILDINVDRKFVHISNLSDTHVFLGLGMTAELNKGVSIPPHSTYEISAMKGNLYKGFITAIADETGFVNIFDKNNITQGGVNITGHSTSSTRTKAYPISVEANTTYTIKINSDNIKLRNIVEYNTSDISSGEWILEDTKLNQYTFKTGAHTTRIAISFCKEDISENLTVDETKTAGIFLFKSEIVLSICEGE